jgi:hypothetical protein
MAHISLRTVLVDLTKNLNETEKLAAAAHQWVSISFPKGMIRFSLRYREIVTGLAFFQAFLAWEAFLDESFTLYLWGKRPPRGHRPRRLYTPSTRNEAMRLIVGERKYADWTKIDELNKRAKIYFDLGEPYNSAFIGQRAIFNDMSVIRNAIAHSSVHSKIEFKEVVRKNLFGAYPPNLTVGGFLAMTRPKSYPPESFLEYYLNTVLNVAEKIVPN